MTTRTTTIGQEQPGRAGKRTVLSMTAVTGLLLAAAAVGVSRSGGRAPTAPAPAAVARPVSDSTAPRGGMAEQYAVQQSAAATAAEGTAGHLGGMSKLYRDQAAMDRS